MVAYMCNTYIWNVNRRSILNDMNEIYTIMTRRLTINLMTVRSLTNCLNKGSMSYNNLIDTQESIDLTISIIFKITDCVQGSVSKSWHFHAPTRYEAKLITFRCLSKQCIDSAQSAVPAKRQILLFIKKAKIFHNKKAELIFAANSTFFCNIIIQQARHCHLTLK